MVLEFPKSLLDRDLFVIDGSVVEGLLSSVVAVEICEIRVATPDLLEEGRIVEGYELDFFKQQERDRFCARGSGERAFVGIIALPDALDVVQKGHFYLGVVFDFNRPKCSICRI